VLPTGYSVFLVAAALFCVGVALGTAIFASRCRRYCDLAYQAMQENSIEALSSTRLAELDRTLTELSDSFSSLEASHKRLRSKYSMRDMRERRNDANGADEQPQASLLPDDDAAKAAFKTKLRAQCKERGLI